MKLLRHTAPGGVGGTTIQDTVIHIFHAARCYAFVQQGTCCTVRHMYCTNDIVVDRGLYITVDQVTTYCKIPLWHDHGMIRDRMLYGYGTVVAAWKYCTVPR